MGRENKEEEESRGFSGETGEENKGEREGDATGQPGSHQTDTHM